MSTRIMTAGADLTGQHFNTLDVLRLVARRPEPRYECRCRQCGTLSTENQRDLSQGRSQCRNGGCTRAQAAEEASLTLGQFQRREEQKQQRHIDRLKHEFESAARKTAEFERDTIARGTDADCYVDPYTEQFTSDLSSYELSVFNEHSALQFVQATPEFYACPENLEALSGYVKRNGLRAVTFDTLRAAYERLTKFGLLKPHPAPATKPLDYASRPNVEVRIAASTPTKPEPLIGYDPRTGEQREFTKREVDQMSADEYRRVFRVYKSELQLPNIGPGGRIPR